MNVKERFLNYVVIDSGSSETTGTHPSTEKQWDMARLLEKELKEMGAENVRVSPTWRLRIQTVPPQDWSLPSSVCPIRSAPSRTTIRTRNTGLRTTPLSNRQANT